MRLWQRHEDHYHWIRSFILGDQERTIFVTLSFRRFVTVVHAKEVAKKVVRWLQSEVTESWIKVLERGGGGVHIHLLVRLKRSVSAKCGLESLEITIQRHNQRRKVVEKLDVRRVWDAEGMSEYLVKTLLQENKAGRVPGRAITHSEDIDKAPWWLRKGGRT
jgi:hypothetical protein